MRRVVSLVLALVLLASPNVALASSSVTANSPVLITGSFGVGGTLTALYPTDDPSISATFEWFTNGTKINSAQSATLLLGADLVGTTVSARITLRKTGLTDLVVEAAGARAVSYTHLTLPTKRIV